MVELWNIGVLEYRVLEKVFFHRPHSFLYKYASGCCPLFHLSIIPTFQLSQMDGKHMKWSKEAEQAIAKVPFFIRKRVRKRVEEEASSRGRKEVNLEDVQACKERFVHRMEEEVKGFQVETCFAQSGCPNRAVEDDDLVKKLERKLAAKNLKAFLKRKVQGPLKFHHEFRVSISDCPNACSRPQIVDIGLIGARKPVVSEEETCTECGACIETCKEGAITIRDALPTIDEDRCVACGQCIDVCPTGILKEGAKGYQVLVGGKLGRHPRLGKEVPGIYSEEEVLKMVDQCIGYYQHHCVEGERFGEVLERGGLDDFLENRDGHEKK